MVITVFRTLIMYLFVVLALRVMGKRQIGELEASELVVTIIISDIAAMPITNTEVPLITNISAILLIMALEVILSFFAYKSTKVRELLYGKASIFFKNGKFDRNEMMRQRFNLADVMEEIRGNGICSISDVEYIVMETNGRVSVIQKSEKAPITAEQFNMKPEPVRMSYIIIDNGTVMNKCMKYLGLNNEWLYKTLKKNNINSPKDVFYMSFEEMSGKTVVMPMEGSE